MWSFSYTVVRASLSAARRYTIILSTPSNDTIFRTEPAGCTRDSPAHYIYHTVSLLSCAHQARNLSAVIAARMSNASSMALFNSDPNVTFDQRNSMRSMRCTSAGTAAFSCCNHR